jgi:nitroreductase
VKVEDAIKKRRSIRRYTEKMPNEEDIRKILEAAIWAPSGLNNQPWKFKVINDKDEKDGLAKFTSYGKIIKRAQAAICVFLDKDTMYNREKDTMAIGACIQNILLQAHALGIGTCWLGEILNKKEQVEKYLKVRPAYELMAVITLGYPGEKAAGSRKKLKGFLV